MGGAGEPPPPPLPPPPLSDKRRAQSMIRVNKTLKDNNGQPIRNIDLDNLPSTSKQHHNLNQNQNPIQNQIKNDNQNFIQDIPIEHNYNKLVNTTILYPQHHPGPFFVLVTSDTPVSTRRKNCELHLYARFQKINIPNNYVCKNIGYNTFRITFNNFNAANNFALNPNLSGIGLKAEIPDRFVQRFYIVKNVPKSIEGLTIKESIEANNEMEVISIYRFSRKNDKNEYEPTETVKIGIVSDGPPPEIFMCGAKIIPELYVPPIRQCLHCGRLGHIASRCRSAKRCLKCGQFIICPINCKEEKCRECLATTLCKGVCNSPRCILCSKTDHISTDVDKCAKWESERNLREIMTLSNLSRKEVFQKYPETQNFYQILSDEAYQNNFPSIRRTKEPLKRNINDEINRRITRIKYSTIAAPAPKRIHAVASPVVLTPAQPVFNYPNFSKVSDLEKTLSVFASQMSKILTSLNSNEGLSILQNFQKSIISAPTRNKNCTAYEVENQDSPT